MSQFLNVPRPAFREVDDAGNVTFGPHEIWIDGRNGVNLKEMVFPNYTPHVFGPIEFAGYAQVPLLIGYRAQLSIQLTDIETSTTLANWGQYLLATYYLDSFAEDSFAKVQFNLYYGNGGGPWRGIQFSSGYALRPMGGKMNKEALMDLELDFYTRDLQQVVIDTNAKTW